MLLPVETFVEPASGSTLPVLDQPLGVTGELDGGQTEENESPLRRDRSMPGTPPRKIQRNTSPRRTSESKREKAAPEYAAPSMVRALRETTRTSQKRAAVGEKLFW